MLHNKFFWILEQFLSDYSREIYGRGLVGKIKISQKAIAIALDELESQGILRSRKQANLKYFRLNTMNSEIKDIMIIVELIKKVKFLSKHRRLANIFKQDDRIVGIFGSYAIGTEKEDSDIDVFVIGKKIKNDYEKKSRVFDMDVSIKYFSDKEFRLLIKNKNNLCMEIIGNHVIIFGVERFINLIWKDYYGFT